MSRAAVLLRIFDRDFFLTFDFFVDAFQSFQQVLNGSEVLVAVIDGRDVGRQVSGQAAPLHRVGGVVEGVGVRREAPRLEAVSSGGHI